LGVYLYHIFENFDLCSITTERVDADPTKVARSHPLDIDGVYFRGITGLYNIRSEKLYQDSHDYSSPFS
jgi:hypothetical protein